MAKITNEDMQKLARLSQLKLSDDETAKYIQEIESILGFVEKLQSINTDGVIETSQVTGLVNATRKDTIVDYGVGQAELLKNTHSQDKGYIKVKRVL